MSTTPNNDQWSGILAKNAVKNANFEQVAYATAEESPLDIAVTS
jgi:hypothetical protein